MSIYFYFYHKVLLENYRQVEGHSLSKHQTQFPFKLDRSFFLILGVIRYDRSCQKTNWEWKRKGKETASNMIYHRNTGIFICRTAFLVFSSASLFLSKGEIESNTSSICALSFFKSGEELRQNIQSHVFTMWLFIRRLKVLYIFYRPTCKRSPELKQPNTCELISKPLWAP